jgi:hypothetical protein
LRAAGADDAVSVPKSGVNGWLDDEQLLVSDTAVHETPPGEAR